MRRYVRAAPAGQGLLSSRSTGGKFRGIITLHVFTVAHVRKEIYCY